MYRSYFVLSFSKTPDAHPDVFSGCGPSMKSAQAYFSGALKNGFRNFPAELIQPALNGAVEQLSVDLDREAAQDLAVHLSGEQDFLSADLLQFRLQGTDLLFRERDGADHSRLRDSVILVVG